MAITGRDARARKVEVDTKLEAAMKRLTYALGNREAADAVKKLIEVMLEARS